MNIPWMVGNTDDFRERPERMSGFESVVLIAVLVAAATAIGAMTLLAGVARAVLRFAQDPNAGPYRQVR